MTAEMTAEAAPAATGIQAGIGTEVVTGAAIEDARGRATETGAWSHP